MEGNGQSESAIPEKDLFRIGEVSRLTATKQFVLRYWETEFPMLQPEKSPKGHRLYRRQDIETVFTIKRLLYDEGFTIAGARRHLRDQVGSDGGAVPSEPHAPRLFEELDGELPMDASGEPEVQHATQPAMSRSTALLDRKLLLDLRDSLRSFLTLLESE
jgi:DNA-binding transcriptional MerR regulator